MVLDLYRYIRQTGTNWTSSTHWTLIKPRNRAGHPGLGASGERVLKNPLNNEHGRLAPARGQETIILARKGKKQLFLGLIG